MPHLTNTDDGVRFDIKGNGSPLRLSWTAPGKGNAFLALDRNGNGIIDDGKELFGNFTDQPESDEPNGYKALAVFDLPENGGNGDGVIDKRDAIWPKLLLWIDENHDGISQPNELHHLDEMGVHSLSLRYHNDPYVDQFGNQFRYEGKVNPEGQPKGDEVDRISYDVFFLGKVRRASPQSTSSDRELSGFQALNHWRASNISFREKSARKKRGALFYLLRDSRPRLCVGCHSPTKGRCVVPHQLLGCDQGFQGHATGDDKSRAGLLDEMLLLEAREKPADGRARWVLSQWISITLVVIKGLRPTQAKRGLEWGTHFMVLSLLSSRPFKTK